MDKQRLVTWDKAVAHALKLKNGTTGCKSLNEMHEKFEQLRTNSIQNIKAGKFKQAKVPLLLVEVQSVDQVGNCYRVKCSDVNHGRPNIEI